MMSDAWEDMKKTKEEEYFQRQNREVLEKSASRAKSADNKNGKNTECGQAADSSRKGLLGSLVQTIKELIGK